MAESRDPNWAARSFRGQGLRLRPLLPRGSARSCRDASMLEDNPACPVHRSDPCRRARRRADLGADRPSHSDRPVPGRMECGISPKGVAQGPPGRSRRRSARSTGPPRVAPITDPAPKIATELVARGRRCNTRFSACGQTCFGIGSFAQHCRRSARNLHDRAVGYRSGRWLWASKTSRHTRQSTRDLLINALTGREAFQSPVVASQYSLIWAGSLVRAQLNARDKYVQSG
jgi:hypothetical protein